MPGTVINRGFKLGPDQPDSWTYDWSINDYRYDHSDFLILHSYEFGTPNSENIPAGFDSYYVGQIHDGEEVSWQVKRDDDTGLQPDDYIKLNNNFLQYFASMRSPTGSTGRNFLTSGYVLAGVSYYSDFSTKDVLTVYPNQKRVRTSQENDPNVKSGATIKGIGENILGEGDHIPQLPLGL